MSPKDAHSPQPAATTKAVKTPMIDRLIAASQNAAANSKGEVDVSDLTDEAFLKLARSKQK
ncbi:MAG: hypothetical protein SFV19_08015 [Rhodospirillaceae bacterium]|nr:hypothetical protein [Rhodospirillaceae bacterium]